MGQEKDRSLQAAGADERKMEALGRMAGVMSHDINNMLGAIEGYASLAMRGLPETDPLRSDMEEIRKAVGRASALTKKLLSFSRRHTVNKVPVPLGAFLSGLADKLCLDPGIKIELAVQPGLGEINADPQQLEQLLTNLLLNARDAMPGGAVRLAAGLSGEGEGAFVRISVSDDGPGMPPETVEHLFEPFFTTKERGKGIGLGLAEAYGIARRHGGRIEVRTAEGAGAEFAVLLPAAAPAAAAEREKAGRAPARRPGRTSILIIEDDEDLSSMIQRALNAAGYETAKAARISDALSLIRENPSGYDVIFSDIMLPDGSIIDTAAELAGRDPGARFVFASGYTQSEEAMAFIRKHGFRFLLKPYAIDALLRAIEESLKI